MIRDDVEQLIRDRLGFNNALSQEIILRHMDLVQAKYETGGQNGIPRPWFCFKPKYSVMTNAHTQVVEMPTNFSAFHDDWPVTIMDSAGVLHSLLRERYTEVALTDLSPDAETLPTVFVLGVDYMQVFPVPDQSYEINVPHFTRLTDLSSSGNQDSPWFAEFPGLIVEEVTFSLARSTRDEKALKLSTMKSEIDSYFRRVEERDHLLQEYNFNSYG